MRVAKVEWLHLDGYQPYAETLAAMEARVAAISAGTAPEAVWLLEHPPLYTAGTSARAEDLVDPGRFPVHVAGRGGQYTYHGPGQRVVYVMLDVGARGRDVRQFVCALENWVIDTLAAFNVTGERAFGPGRGLGQPPGPCGAGRPARRGQDRRHRGQAAPLGQLSRPVDQRRSRPVAFHRNRALRHPRPRRHEPCRPWPAGDDGGCGYRPEAGLCARIFPNRHEISAPAIMRAIA